MKKIRYLNPVIMPKVFSFPEPHVVWMGLVVKEWDQKSLADAGIVGIPSDRGVVVPRIGARFGPKTIREILYSNTTYSYELDVDLSSLKIVDCGDVDVDIMSYNETHRRVEFVLTHIFNSGMIPLIIGGDHSLTYPCVKALWKSQKKGVKIGVIDFDAHHDCRADWKENSGLWVREIQELEGEPIRGEHIAQIGIRGFGYSPFYRDYIKKTGVKVFTAMEVKEKGIKAVVEDAIKIASDGTDMVYLSVDIDVLDQTFAPGTSAPSPGGLSPWELLSSIFYIEKNCPVRALDVMEVSPPLDIDNMTSRIGASIILNYLCGLAWKKED